MWIERNRLWLVPWVSAFIVLMIEVLAGLFASKPIPVEGHGALAAFWIFAVSRGGVRLQRQRAREGQLLEYARARGIPLEEARTEWDAFEATVARTPLPPWRGHDD
jgi:hypothetical protein